MSASRTKTKTILAPSDLSSASVKGVIEAATLARTLGARLIVMTAIPRQRSYDHAQYLDQTMDTVRMRLKAWFVRHVPAELREGLPVRFVTVVDAPAPAILAVAGTEDVDLIVMAERPHSTLDRLLHRSTTEAVVRSAARPVIAVRATGAAAGTTAAA